MTLAALIKQAAGDAQQYAEDADDALAAVETATRPQDFEAAQTALATASAGLCNVLFDLGPLWLNPGPKAPPGFGLLNVPTALQARDSSLLGLYNEVLNTVSGKAQSCFACAVETLLFVYPEKSPLSALLGGCRRLDAYTNMAPADANQLYANLAAIVRADNFWVPTGAGSLTNFIAALDPPDPPAGAGPGAPDADVAAETLARTQLQIFQWSWATLRDTLSKGTQAQQDTLKQILDYRGRLTRALMATAVSDAALAAVPRYGRRYRWVTYNIPGSTRLTSDIDVNMRGSYTELVVRRFNELFRAWLLGWIDVNGNLRASFNMPAPVIGPPPNPPVPPLRAPLAPGAPAPSPPDSWVPAGSLESGFVFDVNVYANDYLRSSSRRFLDTPPVAPTLVPKAADAQKEAERRQDVWALVKMRRYMSIQQWGAFANGLQAVLVSSNVKEDVAGRVTDAVTKYQAREQAITTLVTAGASRTSAENQLYEAQLLLVEALRFGNGQDDASKLALVDALGYASALAQEAYHTEGAVLDIVANSQMRSGVRLSSNQLLCSANEQVGDLFKDLNSPAVIPDGEGADLPAVPAPGPVPAPGIDQVQTALDASKYLVRLTTAALNLSYRVTDQLLAENFLNTAAAASLFQPANPGDPDWQKTYALVQSVLFEPDKAPTVFQALVTSLQAMQKQLDAWLAAGVKLLAMKDNPGSFKDAKGNWTQDAQNRLRAAPGGGDLQKLGDAAVNLAILLNGLLRGQVRASAFGNFAQAALGAVRALASSGQPAASAQPAGAQH